MRPAQCTVCTGKTFTCFAELFTKFKNYCKRIVKRLQWVLQGSKMRQFPADSGTKRRIFARFLYIQQGGTTHMKKLMGILLACLYGVQPGRCGHRDTVASSAAVPPLLQRAAATTRPPTSRSVLSFWATRPKATAPRTSTASRKLPPSWACPMTRSSGSTRSLRRRHRRRSRGPCRPGLQPDHLQLLRPSDLHGGGSLRSTLTSTLWH